MWRCCTLCLRVGLVVVKEKWTEGEKTSTALCLKSAVMALLCGEVEVSKRLLLLFHYVLSRLAHSLFYYALWGFLAPSRFIWPLVSKLLSTNLDCTIDVDAV